MEQLTIQEWFARAVAAGLMPEWTDIIYRNGYITNTMDSIKVPFDENERIQLRLNNKNLYSLEWRKPTEKDIGKNCFFWNGVGNIGITSAMLYRDWFFESLTGEYLVESDEGIDYRYCLLADHRQIAPTEANFKKIYGEQNDNKM